MPTTVSGPSVLHPRTAIAGAAVAEGQLLKRGADSNTLIANTAGTIATRGVALEDQDTAGHSFRYVSQPGDRPLVRAGAAFAEGAKLMSDASGRAITATATNIPVAIALEAATAADQLVTAELMSQGMPVL
jgi:uncharacterized protein DUF2190